MAHVEATDHFYESIVNICNEEKIYNWLFRESLEGKPYTRTKAESFKKWGTDGWNSNTHFVFLTLSESADVAAACSIKSSDLESAEIGYWSSSNHRGIMTNAVKAMVKNGFEAGFKSFFAKVKSKNSDSAAVLVRAGFLKSNKVDGEGFETYHLQNPSK